MAIILVGAGAKMKEEALKLADELSQYTINDGVDDLNKRTIAMIRRLVAELDKQKPTWTAEDEDRLDDALEDAYGFRPIRQGEPDYYMLTRDHTWLSCDEETYNKLDPDFRMKCYPVAPKPLSDEEINQIWRTVLVDSLSWDGLQKKTTVDIEFARAIEERHGIK